jgi:hypothetical protein
VVEVEEDLDFCDDIKPENENEEKEKEKTVHNASDIFKAPALKGSRSPDNQYFLYIRNYFFIFQAPL